MCPRVWPGNVKSYLQLLSGCTLNDWVAHHFVLSVTRRAWSHCDLTRWVPRHKIPTSEFT